MQNGTSIFVFTYVGRRTNHQEFQNLHHPYISSLCPISSPIFSHELAGRPVYLRVPTQVLFFTILTERSYNGLIFGS